MSITIDRETTVSILNSLAIKLDLPIEDVVDLVVAYMDVDTVLAMGKKLSDELKTLESV